MLTPFLRTRLLWTVALVAAALLLAARPAGATPRVAWREARSDQVVVRVTVDNGTAPEPCARVRVEVENVTTEPILVPAEGPFPGLTFHLFDDLGRIWFDAAEPEPVPTLVELAPGEVLTHSLDLGRTTLVRYEGVTGDDAAHLDGLFDDAEGAALWADLMLFQLAGDEMLELPRVRLRLLPEVGGGGPFVVL